jgi:hypothetical protein
MSLERCPGSGVAIGYTVRSGWLPVYMAPTARCAGCERQIPTTTEYVNVRLVEHFREEAK